MTIGSGLGKSFGIAPESTPGVFVAPTVWAPLVDDSLKKGVGRIMSKGVIAGARGPRTQQWAPGAITVDGAVDLELDNLSMGKFMKVCMGAVATTGPVSGLYTHTFTPGDLADDSFSWQKNYVDVGGTNRPTSGVGAMVDSWEIGFQADEDLTFQISPISINSFEYRQVTDAVTTSSSPTLTSATAVFKRGDVGSPISDGGVKIPAASYIGVVNSATSIGLSSSPTSNTPVNASSAGTGITTTIGVAYSSPSYASGIAPITAYGTSVTIAGVGASVKSGTIGGKNNLATGRRFIGSNVIKQAKEVALRNYGGKLLMEFEDNTQYLRYINGDEFALVVTAVAGSQQWAFTCNARYDGSSPTQKGTDIGEIELPYTCIGVTADPDMLTAVYTSSESTP